MVICAECAWSELSPGLFAKCSNSELPVTDFVYGEKDCIDLNPHGDCKGFIIKPGPESIYESKEDKELARTDATN